MQPVPPAPKSRTIARSARRATLGLCLLGLAGCAASRWVDDRTPGDLWGTGGREMGLVTWLRDVQPGPATDETATDRTARDEALLDAMIELVLTGIAIW